MSTLFEHDPGGNTALRDVRGGVIGGALQVVGGGEME